MTRYSRDLLDPLRQAAILVSGGPSPQPSLLCGLRAQLPHARFLCADVGADLCRAAGVVPDGIVGDMDSLTAKTRNWLEDMKVPEVVYPAEKDDSDQALAVMTLFEGGAEEIVVVGGLGGRMDHALANMMQLVAFGRAGKSLVYWDDSNRVRYVGVGAHTLENCDGYIGIVPFSDAGMTLSIKGLHYTLDHFTVPFGETRLVSNVFDEAAEATITIHQGDGVLVRCHDGCR